MWAKDNYGVWGESASVSVTVIGIPPTVTINPETTTVYTEGYTDLILSGEATDNSGIERTYWMYNGNEFDDSSSLSSYLDNLSAGFTSNLYHCATDIYFTEGCSDPYDLRVNGAPIVNNLSLHPTQIVDPGQKVTILWNLVDFEATNPNHAGLEAAWESLYIAEGSDWFWWYGLDQDSGYDENWDVLFKVHLSNIYRAINYFSASK